jgi:hypothetical protein
VKAGIRIGQPDRPPEKPDEPKDAERQPRGLCIALHRKAICDCLDELRRNVIRDVGRAGLGDLAYQLGDCLDSLDRLPFGEDALLG